MCQNEYLWSKGLKLKFSFSIKKMSQTFFDFCLLSGEIIHSAKFNDVISNGMTGKRVLVVGIGNSAVDAAVNCASIGR